jgi:hypothetical protein
MKTDQLMTLSFKQGDIDGFHKSGMICLTDIFTVGNKYRILGNQTSSNITHFLNSKNTQEFIAIICDKQGVDKEEVYKKIGKGGNARIFCNIHLAIYAAEYLSPEFHYEVIDNFIKSRIFQYRDESGDEYIALNMYIDTHLPDRIGKNNKGIYINVAKILKNKILKEDETWNTATSDQLLKRFNFENQLCNYLKMGLIKDWEHLKQIIEKLS